MLLRGGKPIDAKYAVRSLTVLAEKAGLRLDFAAHAEAVEKLRVAAEPEYDLSTQKDEATLVNIFNHVSGESLTLESVPRIVKEKKGRPPVEAPSPEKGKEKEKEKEKEAPEEKRRQAEGIVAVPDPESRRRSVREPRRQWRVPFETRCDAALARRI
jgi:hypothetical protein